MINKLAIIGISYYQQYISPHKGYCCAYKHYTGKSSCSEFTKESIKKYGIIKTFPLFKEQIKRCQAVYFSEKIKKPKKEIDKCNEAAGICACL